MAGLIHLIFVAFEVLILVRVVISWANVSPYDPTFGPIITWVNRLTEPFLEPVRRRLPPTSALDFSPIIVLVIAIVLEGILVRLFS